MNKIKVRYTLKNKHTGYLHYKKYFISQIEQYSLSKLFDVENYDIVARDLFIEKIDKIGNEIYNNDIIKDHDNLFVVNYSEHYSEFVLVASSFSHHKISDSIAKTRFSVIGNIHENSDLLS